MRVGCASALVELGGRGRGCRAAAGRRPDRRRQPHPSTVGVACIGDFRHAEMPQAQWDQLVAICAALSGMFGLEPVEAIHAHDALVGASSDPEKECPGRFVDMTRLRREAGAKISAAGDRLSGEAANRGGDHPPVLVFADDGRWGDITSSE